MKRRNISSGYSRAVRVGHLVEFVGPDDPYLQAKYALEKIGRALAEAGAASLLRSDLLVEIEATAVAPEGFP